MKSLHMLIGLVVGFILLGHHTTPEGVGPGDTSQAAVEVALLVVSVGLSILAQQLLSDGSDAAIRDEKPTTLTARGSYTNWVLGRRRVGPIFAWAGNRGSRKESGGKKGSSLSPKQKIWLENGWHVIAGHRLDCLHKIRTNGKVIFDGPIDAIGTPSGSFIDLGEEGGFFIHWGEATQPVNTFIGDSSRVGIASRWPHHATVTWVERRLGPQPQWSLLDYEVERFPTTSPALIPNTSAMIEDPPVLNGVFYEIVEVGPDWLRLAGSVSEQFNGKDLVRWDPGFGPLTPPRNLTVTTTQVDTVEVTPFIFTSTTRVFFLESMTGISAGEFIQEYDKDPRSGVNAAHALAELLFSPWPLGFGSDVTEWDLTSFEDLAVLTESEDLRISLLAKEGQKYSELVAGFMQDIGIFIPLDTATGLLKLVPLREPTGALPRIREQLLAEALPEIDKQHGTVPVDKIVFAFPDRRVSDRGATIAVMDDGSVAFSDSQRGRTVPIVVTNDFDTASTIAQRRSQEEMGQSAAIKLVTKRGSRKLIPGQSITVDKLAQVMRVLDVKIETESPKVTISLLPDKYGVRKADFQDTTHGSESINRSPEPDLAKAIVEIPERLTGADGQVIIVPRIRAHDQISEAFIHLSGDNLSYVPQATELDLQTGGTLIAELPDDTLTFLPNGFAINVLGPDISIVEDLTGDLLNWNLGRQVAVIASSAGTEICFVRSITALGGTSFRLDGIYRGRYGTLPLAHPAGAVVFVFSFDEILALQDPLLTPTGDLYAKTQPAASGVLPLSADTPTFLDLYGKGARPGPVSGLHVRAPLVHDVWRAGQDTVISWTYPTPRTPDAGFGSQALGQAAVSPAPDSDFLVEIVTASMTVVRSVTRVLPNYTYTDADRIADGIGADFTVRVTQV